MNKKDILVCGLMVATLCISAVSASQRKPNFVLFLVDDLGSGEVGCYASKFHETPNIDAQAAQGMLFTTAYPHYDETRPYSSAIIGDWKVIRYADAGKVELDQLANDPMEENNLAAQNPEKDQQMVQQMKELLEGANFQPVLPNPDHDPGKFSGGIPEYRGKHRQ